MHMFQSQRMGNCSEGEKGGETLQINGRASLFFPALHGFLTALMGI
jgi:hypothetical protein